jgi:hypothetical protein
MTASHHRTIARLRMTPSLHGKWSRGSLGGPSARNPSSHPGSARRVWSVYGALRAQPVATGGKSEDPGNGGNKPKPLPPVATSCRRTLMVRRGRRFESVRGLYKDSANRGVSFSEEATDCRLRAARLDSRLEQLAERSSQMLVRRRATCHPPGLPTAFRCLGGRTGSTYVRRSLSSKHFAPATPFPSR